MNTKLETLITTAPCASVKAVFIRNRMGARLGVFLRSLGTALSAAVVGGPCLQVPAGRSVTSMT